MQITDISEAKVTLPRLIQRVSKEEDFIIGKVGKPDAILVPYDLETIPRQLGTGHWQGKFRIADDFDDMPVNTSSILPVRLTEMDPIFGQFT